MFFVLYLMFHYISLIWIICKLQVDIKYLISENCEYVKMLLLGALIWYHLSYSRAIRSIYMSSFVGIPIYVLRFFLFYFFHLYS